MSGFVCVWNRDGAPLDPALLQRMTDAMAFRGPDRGGTWLDGTVGFGHRLFATTFEAAREQQPCTLDGLVYIAADARIDDRERLKDELIGMGRQAARNATDVELILHAYHAWGEACVDHLLGDFSFVIWDARAQRVFCARDHWGLRLLYYAQIGAAVIVSNTLNVIRLHPAVSDRLNEQAIGDFLLFDFNPELDTTTFAEIQRLPPAHTMTVTSDGLRQRRYWTVPRDQEIRFKRDQDYIDRFHELLRTAVADRLRTDKLGIYLSGGLDSPTIAAAAAQIAASERPGCQLSAATYVYDRLIPDDERHYAGLVAEALGLKTRFIPQDDARLFDPDDPRLAHIPEPFHWPVWHQDPAAEQPFADGTRSAFYGEDGDALLHPATLVEMLPTQGLVSTARDAIGCWLRFRRRPSLGLGILERLRRLRSSTPAAAERYPTWLEPEFERRLNLRARWAQQVNLVPVPPRTRRPWAYRRVMQPLWQSYLESLDFGVNLLAFEHRLPLMDVRLATYLLALPVLPWCAGKYLLRASGRGVLPDVVLARRKTPLQGDPLAAKLKGERAQANAPLAEALPAFVAVDRWDETYRQAQLDDAYLRVRRLNCWLIAHAQ